MTLLTEDLHNYTSVYQDSGVDKNEEGVVNLSLFLSLISNYKKLHNVCVFVCPLLGTIPDSLQLVLMFLLLFCYLKICSFI